MRAIFRCSKCGSDCYEGDESCSNCGYEFAYICRACKQDISYDAEMCKHCGKSAGKALKEPYKEHKKISIPFLVIGLIFAISAIASLFWGGIIPFLVQGTIATVLLLFAVRRKPKSASK